MTSVPISEGVLFKYCKGAQAGVENMEVGISAEEGTVHATQMNFRDAMREVTTGASKHWSKSEGAGPAV